MNTLGAIFWKELRTGLKWAALGAVVMTAALLRTLVYSFPLVGLSNWLYGVTQLVAPLVAIVIGLAQIIPENRGDKWGFLTHRPVTRSTLFWGKALAGMLLYAAATAIPFAILMAWIATPGHVTLPFDAGLALPGVVDLVCGLVYYFAALLAGMREARWYGSRALGTGAALVCSAGVSAAPEVWQALLVCAVALVVVGGSAWGTFLSGGRFAPQAPAARTATGVSVFTGILLVWFVSACLVVASLHHAEAAAPRHSEYVLTGDGTLTRVLFENSEIVAVTDLEGKPLPQYGSAVRPSEEGHPPGLMETSMEVNPGAPSTGYRDTWRFVTELHQTGVEERMPYQWYYVERERLIAGYERRTARLIGWLGPDGFTSPTALATSFQKPLRLMGYENSWGLADASGFYRIDLDKRTVQKLFTASPGETVVAGAVGSASGAGPRGRGQYFEAFATTKNLFVQSVLLRVGFPQLADGALSFKTPLAPLPSPYRELKIRRALRAEGAPFFLWYEPDYDPWGRLPTQAFKLDQQGEVVARYTLPSLLETPNIPWSHTVILASGMPLMVRGAIEAEFRRSGAHVLIAWSSREQEVFSWILPIVAALLSAVFIYLRARSYAFGARRLWVWTVLGLALGPLGILLMMALIEWPARETCPSCGRKRVVTNERCEHCRAPFAPVTADGSEIFDPALAP